MDNRFDFQQRKCKIFIFIILSIRSWESSISIVTTLQAGQPRNWSAIPSWRNISFLHTIHTGPEAHPVSSPTGTTIK
jgi:hypothetical protein